MYKPSFILAGLIPVVSLAADPTKELDFFEQKVRPIFANNCYSCHSIEQGKSKGGGGRHHPMSPWGQLAKGFKTRKKHKTTSTFIVERRKSKKK